MFTQKDLNEMLAEGQTMLTKINIPISKNICPEVDLVFAHSFFGRCVNKSAKLKHFPKGYDYLIQVSLYALQNTKKSVMNTILHELIHTCSDCRGHDAKWKGYAEKAGKEYGYDIKRCGGDKTVMDCHNLNKGRKIINRRTFDRYLISCPACGMHWKYTRKSRVVQDPAAAKCPCGHKGLKLEFLAIPIK